MCRWSSKKDSSQLGDLGSRGSAAGPHRTAVVGQSWRWCSDSADTSSKTCVGFSGCGGFCDVQML